MNIRSIPKPLWLLSIATVLLLIVGGFRFQEVFQVKGYSLFFALALVVAVVYPLVAVIVLSRSVAKDEIVHEGLRAGSVVSAIFFVDLMTEYFWSLPQQAESVITLIVMLSIFLTFALVAYHVSRANSLAAGIEAALLAGGIGTLFVVALGTLTNLMFPHRLELVLQGEYLVAVSHLSLTAYTFQNTIDSALTHLGEVPILAIVFGSLGGGMSRVMRRR